MAIQLTKIGNSPNTPTKDCVCDLRTEIEKLPKVVMGSTCFCLEDKSVWVKGSDEWKEITGPTSSNKELETLEQLIDESGVLESIDGTATEKVEQLIDKAEWEKIWYEQSKTWTDRFKFLFYFGQLKNLPRLDFSKATDMSDFASYSTIETVDYYINSTVANRLYQTFCHCAKLKFVYGIATAKAQMMYQLFCGCKTLETIQEPLDFSSTSTTAHTTNCFHSCYALKNIRFVEESIPVSLSFAYSKYLTIESIQSIIDGLATVETAQTLTLHADVKAKLTQEQLTTITNKNWTLA